MPIILNGVTFENGGTATYNGTELSSIQVSLAGADPVEVWVRAITVVNLVNWNGFSTAGLVNNGTAGTASSTAGKQLVSGTSTGRANGRVSQNINMVNGHKYWLYYGTYTMSGQVTNVNTPLGNKSLGGGTQTTSEIVTYTGTTGSQTVSAAYAGSDNTGSAYSRLCSMNIVDLTDAFGAGNEPTASWCVSNLGIFNGSKTIIP